METINLFITDIINFSFELPNKIKLGIVTICIILCVSGYYIINNMFDMGYLTPGVKWFFMIMFVNLLVLLFIIYGYNKKKNTYIGKPGKVGKRGIRGKVGNSVTCTYKCKNNLYIDNVRKADTICLLNTYTDDFNNIYDNFDYFNDLIIRGHEIDYSSFIKDIILNNETSNLAINVINRFNNLLASKYIMLLLIKIINENITPTSDKLYGTFKSVVPKVGFIPLGNSVYGGAEYFSLNSFVVSGDIMYPDGFNKLISFKSFNDDTKDYDIYTLWEPVSQIISDNSKNKNEKVIYSALGDICSFGETRPKISDIALINENCLEETNIKELKLIFVYFGNVSYKENITDQDTKLSYLINNDDNKMVNTIEIFSVWRTPLNTFITNKCSRECFMNDTIISNILGNIENVYNNFGVIKHEYKNWVNNVLSGCKFSSIIIALIYIKNFEIESYKELAYYINKYKSGVIELKNIMPENMLLYELINVIKDIKLDYEEYNLNLVRQVSIESRKKNVEYDSGKERHLPTLLLKTYMNILNRVETLPVSIENSSSLLDIINNIIPNGLNARIAINSEGLAEGGIILNEMQETIIKICKMLFPPRNFYIIKDDCLGTFKRDNERELKILELTDIKAQYNKYIDIISTDNNKFQNQMEIIKQYEDIAIKKIGLICGHIPNYMDKVHDLDLEEFTTIRINGLIKIYSDTNQMLKSLIDNTPS